MEGQMEHLNGAAKPRATKAGREPQQATVRGNIIANLQEAQDQAYARLKELEIERAALRHALGILGDETYVFEDQSISPPTQPVLLPGPAVLSKGAKEPVGVKAEGRKIPKKMAAKKAEPKPARIKAPSGPRPATASDSTKSDRRPRRSNDDIDTLVASTVSILEKHADGRRAEELRVELGVSAAEMPRILKRGLFMKQFTSKGQKRATTYFAKRGAKASPERTVERDEGDQDNEVSEEEGKE